MVAVQSILLGFTASNCVVFAEYILFALEREPLQYERKVLAAALLTMIIGIHGCFLKTGILVQNILGWIKIALMAVMIATSLFVLFFHRRDSELDLFSPVKSNDFIWKDSIWNWGSIATALFKVSYSYAGFENANNVMNEVKNPIRTLKSAAKSAILTVSILYVLVNIAYFVVVPVEEVKESGELIAALFFERVFGYSLGRRLLPAAIACSAAGNVMVVTFSHVRCHGRHQTAKY
jgi:amino acid transporter